MDLVFFINNLTSIAMILCVHFSTAATDVSRQKEYNWEKLAVYINVEALDKDEAYKACIDELKAEKFYENASGFENLQARDSDMKYYHFLLKIKYFSEATKNKINNKYETLDKSKGRAIAYYFSLVNNVSKKNGMLPIATWCRIHGSGTYYKDDFLKNGTEYEQYLRRITSNTGLSTKEQIVNYNTIDVCLYEIIHNTPYAYFSETYKNDNLNYSSEYQYFKLKPLSWCVVNACCEREENNNNEIQSKDIIKKQCIIQVCHEQLVTAGFITENCTYNYFFSQRNNIMSNYIFSRNEKLFLKEEYKTGLSQFVIGYSQFLEAVYVQYDIIARTPLEWCNLITVPLKKTNRDINARYDSFGIPKEKYN